MSGCKIGKTVLMNIVSKSMITLCFIVTEGYILSLSPTTVERHCVKGAMVTTEGTCLQGHTSYCMSQPEHNHMPWGKCPPDGLQTLFSNRDIRATRTLVKLSQDNTKQMINM